MVEKFWEPPLPPPIAADPGENRTCASCDTDFYSLQTGKIYCDRCQSKGTLATVHRLLERDGRVCGICGDPFPFYDPKEVHIDHIKPRSKGGSNGIDNLQLAHAICNLKKSNKEDYVVHCQKVQRDLFSTDNAATS